MLRYLAIIGKEGGRVAKYLDFNSLTDAQNHTLQYGGFVHDNIAGSKISDLLIDDANNVTVSPPPPPPPPTDDERIDAAFPQTDVAKVIFEAFFEVTNRLQALEGKQPITRQQLRGWLKAKLP